MFGIKRKPDPLLLLGLFVGAAALVTTAVSANERTAGFAGDISNTTTEFSLPIFSDIAYEESAGFVISKNRKGDGLFMSFRSSDDLRNTLLQTGVDSGRDLKDLMDIDVKLSYRLSW